MREGPVVEWIRSKYQGLSAEFTERARRRWAAVEASSLGWGGISAVSHATGIARTTIARGIRELESTGVKSTGRQRRAGAGRKRADEVDPELVAALDRIVEPESRGDPMTPLRWTCKSTRNLAKELTAQGHSVSASTVRQLLRNQGYSLQANRKTREGASHPDRDAQFRRIGRRVTSQLRAGQPAVSVDAKKKETIGKLKNPGRTWRRKREPLKVDVHDFPDPKKGKAVPYGVYDLKHNEAWVSVGISSDTAEFATESIRRWWRRMGRPRYPGAKRLLITADSGGSNSSRCRLWKVELQKLADELNLEIEVCHFPPGTSKWNKIEHRLFCHVTRNWRGRPLESFEIVVNLIGSTTTATGLQVHAQIDGSGYTKGRKVTNAELARVNLKPARFHGEWNYVIGPQLQP
ncbi:MAG TPA: ISAzo13 family transposase [Isosphaeraceae bacterium]|nr:ISAzo13 family transposase [Isosphaeraceae bacterium]